MSGVLKSFLLLIFVVVAGILPVASAGAAQASAITSSPVVSRLGFDGAVVDSYGNDVDSYELSVNEGNIANTKGISAGISSLMWAIYATPLKPVFMAMDWTVQMDWLGTISKPIQGLSSLASGWKTNIGLSGLVFAVSGFIIGVWLLRGQWSRGLGELAVSLVIAGLTVAFFANPVASILGPNGLMIQARNTAFEIGEDIRADANSADLIDGFESGKPVSITASTVDAMVRIPHMLVNYGDVIVEADCLQIYNDNLGQEGAFGKLADCSNKKYYERADSTPFSMVGNIIQLFLPGVVFTVFTAVFIVLMWISILYAGWQGLLLGWSLLLGMIPGGPRAALIRNAMGALQGWIMVVGTMIFVALWMKFISSFFSQDGIPFFLKTFLFNIFLIIGIIALVKFWGPIKAWVGRMGEKLASFTSAASPGNAGVLSAHLSPKALKAEVKEVKAGVAKNRSNVAEKQSLRAERLQSREQRWRGGAAQEGVSAKRVRKLTRRADKLGGRASKVHAKAAANKFRARRLSVGGKG